jgi:nucleoside-diphosphate-sugar epimerase
MTRILVTGGSGFIGRQCLQGMIAFAEGEIHAVSRSGEGPFADCVTWHAGDLRDSEACRALVAQVRPSHLLHGAWIATPGLYAASPENDRWVSAGKALLDAFGKAGGERFTGIGSSAEYGPSDTPCHPDTTPIRPASRYGRAKAEMAEAARAAGRAYGFSTAWGRLFLPYGPHDAAARLIPSLLTAFRERRRVAMSDGLQIRDFIFSPDVGPFYTALLLSGETGAFNVGTGQGTSIRDAALMLARMCDAEDLLDFGVLPRRTDEPAVLVADMESTDRVVHSQLRCQLAEGLGMLVSQSRGP